MAAELAASTFPVTPPADAVAMIEAALSGESPLALVDVRTEGAFRAAHIVGAVRQRQADISRCTNSTPIAFYCQTNAASRQGAYDHLRDHPGHTVYAFGGITALEGAGAPVEGGDAPNHNACVAEEYAARTAAWRARPLAIGLGVGGGVALLLLALAVCVLLRRRRQPKARAVSLPERAGMSQRA